MLGLVSCFNPRPVGVFVVEPACRWGVAFSPPAAICQTTGPILDPKKAFDSPEHELSEYIAKLYVRPLLTSLVSTKVRFFFRL